MEKDKNKSEDILITMLVKGVEVPFIADCKGAKYYTTDYYPDPCSSFRHWGVEPYRSAIFVGPNGIEENRCIPAAAVGGSITNEEACGITVHSTSPDFSGVIARGGSFHLKDCAFYFLTQGDGKHSCDFTGYGTLIAGLLGSEITIDRCILESHGVAKSAIFCDQHSDIIMRNSEVRVMGGTLYEDCPNTADVNVMVSPPWVLGIAGTARGTNLMGVQSSFTVVDSELSANQWGVVSVDCGKESKLTLIDSKLSLLGTCVREQDRKNPYIRRFGSGYGVYIICDVEEEICGTQFNVGTYAAILTGGTATFRSSKGKIRVLSPTTGKELYGGFGQSCITTINSDGWGFMAHDYGTINLREGTIVNSDSATFLIKAGGVTLNVEDKTKLNPGDGIILQIMDNDDNIVGMNYHLPHMPFNTEFHETEGWPSENGQITAQMPTPDNAEEEPALENPDQFMYDLVFPDTQYDVHFNARDVSLNGDIYNGSGYAGEPAQQLTVTLDEGTVLNGAISATEIIHVNEKGVQNLCFTIDEYYYLGRVKNRPFFHGSNTVDVILKNNAVWNVTGPGFISSLLIEAGCIFNGRLFLDGNEIFVVPGKLYTGKLYVENRTTGCEGE